MRLMLPDREVLVRTIRIPAAHGSIPALLLSLRTATDNATGVLWLHGGGFCRSSACIFLCGGQRTGMFITRICTRST